MNNIKKEINEGNSEGNKRNESIESNENKSEDKNKSNENSVNNNQSNEEDNNSNKNIERNNSNFDDSNNLNSDDSSSISENMNNNENKKFAGWKIALICINCVLVISGCIFLYCCYFKKCL